MTLAQKLIVQIIIPRKHYVVSIKRNIQTKPLLE